MLYSCFDAPRGEYKVFEDKKTHPANGDLPVPSIKSLIAGQVGVPAMDAGRPLPGDAVYVGYAPNAQGLVVSCGESFSGFGVDTYTRNQKIFAIVVGSLALYGAYKLVF
jgi:hypothetical protein